MNIIDWEHQIFINQVKALFVPFTAAYEKIFYDVLLPDWTTIEHCWPNAWTIWPMAGKQYWPWECMVRISRFSPEEPNEYKDRQELETSADTIRLKVISSINEIINTFWEEKAYKHISKILHQINNPWEIEKLRKIIKEADPKILYLFFVGLLEWTELGFGLSLFEEFKLLLKKGEPEIINNILNKGTYITKNVAWKDKLIAEKYAIYLELSEYQKQLAA